jgi:hypothetical protein
VNLPERRSPVRGAVDVAAIAGFVYAGELRHGTDPLQYPVLYLDTLAPFLIGWLAVVAVVRVLAPTTRLPGGPGSPLRGGFLWLPACLVGLGLRSTSLFHGGAPPSFAAVALIGGAATIAAARWVATAIADRQMSS